MQPLLTDSNKAKDLYAKAKTSADMDFERERVGISSASTAGFADPLKNVNHFDIREGAKVADLGSGSGHYSLAMSPLVGPTGKVYAVDVQKDLLIKLKNEAESRAYDNIEIIWGDIEKENGTKIKDGLVNVVLISNTLFQVDDKDVLFSEAVRILRGGGRIIIIDWTESFGGLGPVPGAVFNKDEAIALANKHGFKLVRDFDAGAHHYGLVFESSSDNNSESVQKVIEQELV